MRGYWSGRLWRNLAHAALLTLPIALALPLTAVAPRPGVALACAGPALLILLAARKAKTLRKQGVTWLRAVAFGLHTYISKLPGALGILRVIARRGP